MEKSANLIHRIQRRTSQWQNQQRIIQMARQVAAAERGTRQSQDDTVAIFAATTRLGSFTLNAAYALLTGWMLRLSGIPVEHFVCQAGMTHCVLGTNSYNLDQPPPCAACIAQSRRLQTESNTSWFTYHEDAGLVRSLKNLSVEELSHYEYPAEFLIDAPKQMPLGQLVLPSVRWALRRHHLIDDQATRSLLQEYILSAYSLAGQFTEFYKKARPKTVVVFNGALYPEAAVRWVCRQLGVRSVAFEVGFQPFSTFFTDGEPTAYPVNIPGDFELNPEQNIQLDSYLEKRFHGNFTMAGIRFWPEMRGLDPSFLEKASQFRQIVPVFTNVVYDSSQAHANTLFSNMFEWLDLLLEIIQNHSETLFVIRAHPDEKRPVSNKISNESVHDWVYRNGVDKLPNVVFIEPDEFISSYELIQKAKFILVYNSSIGLEAAIMGAPVMCGGKARYTQYPTVFLPASPAELQQTVEDFLQANKIEVPPEFLRNARRFLYFQFYRISLPLDEFLREGEKPGSVYLKPFARQQLLPENSLSMHVIHDGIVNQQPFLLPNS